MSAKKKIYEVNDRVFAKVRGFPAWPARIMEVANTSGSRYKVFFFGTYETATLKKEEIWGYNASTIAKFGKGNQKRKGFAEGMYEIENMPNLKTAEALQEEGDTGSTAPLDTQSPMEEDESPPEPPKTPLAAKEKTPKDPPKTPAASKTPNVGKDKTPSSAKDKTPSSAKDKTPSSAKDKTPSSAKDKTPAPAPKDKTPGPAKEKAPKERAAKERTPSVRERPTRERSSSVRDKSHISEPPKKEEPQRELAETQEEVVPQESSSKKESSKKLEEEENNAVVTSSGDLEEEPSVKSTPADTTTHVEEEEEQVQLERSQEEIEEDPLKLTEADQKSHAELEAQEEEEKQATVQTQLMESSSLLLNNETTPVGRTRNNRSNKRKAEELTPSQGNTPTTAPPPAKKKNVPPPLNVTPSEVSHSPSATVSRSGRIIKPKKFVDDDDPKPSTVEAPPAANNSDANNSHSTPSAEPVVTSTQNPSSKASSTPAALPPKKEPRKMWVEVKSTGDMIEINLDQDKPSAFESKEAELQWEKTTARNALKFKERVESGDFIPDEVRIKLQEKLNRTEEEERILKKAKLNSLKMERIRWLKIEQRLIDLDIEIKRACSATDPDLEACLGALGDFDSMTLAPLMLKKQPSIVQSFFKLRSYVGPKDANGGSTYDAPAEKIRLKTESILGKLKAVFEAPESANFEDFFREELSEFKNAVKSMDKEKLLTLVSDPTKKTKKNKK
eukprot:TRINITY_DN2306_c0_g1_i1.p1 TRINITY_DN2306_c0_g1~~TRINITY_DN2306_c0_g1_i1.p1  ORF type:complete len:729 (+),score=300.56 TRINITY_DN2306_c0_g1_i1:291-2477(+)